MPWLAITCLLVPVLPVCIMDPRGSRVDDAARPYLLKQVKRQGAILVEVARCNMSLTSLTDINMRNAGSR
jgi:hypothetical protein